MNGTCPEVAGNQTTMASINRQRDTVFLIANIQGKRLLGRDNRLIAVLNKIFL